VDSGRLLCPGPQPTRQRLRGHHPAVRTASPGGRSSASTSDTLAVSAGGGRCPLPHPAGLDGRRPAAALSPCCSGATAVSAVRLGMPPGAARTAAVHRGHGRGVRFCGHLLGSAPGPRRRRTATVRTIRRWPRLVDTGRRPALLTPRRRQWRRPPPPRSDQERDRNVRHRPARPPDARSVVRGRPESQRRPGKQRRLGRVHR
jgi:hypothetical protein